MKKLSVSLIIVVLVLAFTGCGAKNGTSNGTNSLTPTTTAGTTSTTGTTTPTAAIPTTTTSNTTTGTGATTGTTTGTVTNTLKDGTYDIKHKSTKPGYEEAIVKISGGKITSIELKRLDDSSVEVNYNDWDGKKGGRPNLKKGRINLANAMVKAQSTNVDAISGATQSSDGWKAAVNDALAQAKK